MGATHLLERLAAAGKGRAQATLKRMLSRGREKSAVVQQAMDATKDQEDEFEVGSPRQSIT